MSETHTITVTVNGQQYTETVPIRMLLVDFLRDVIALTGTHVGCSYEGRCGACTVVVDDNAVKSCMMLAVQTDGRSILTVEGLEKLSAGEGQLHPIQDGFWERHGLQCGFCTSGMMMTIFDVLKSHFEVGEPELTDEAIRKALVGNICRCTGYSHIVAAVQTAAARLNAMPVELRCAHFDVKRLQECRRER
ncbi:MAG TPA: (2Fe-2S)-binding protein [Steroidobacteraceae bacterium]|nr:(2Fe-2S)-binding protein [Steroidobacteraceae bacterium]